jgi:hypothetical protein
VGRFLLIIFTCCAFYGSAQDYFVVWGPEAKHGTHQVISVLPDNGSNFYAFRLSNTQFLQSPKVTRYMNGVPEVTKRISQRINENMVTLEELVVFNGTLLGFLSDKKDGMNSLYMVTYDTEIDPFGEPRVINAYPLPKGWSNRGAFNVLTSRNRQFLCVEYIVPGKRDHFDRYGYKVMDTTFQVVSEGEYEIPYNSRNASVDLRYLTDSGDYILGISVYTNANGGMWKDYNSLEKTVVVHVRENELAEYELFIEGKRVFDIGMSSLDSILIVTGTYGEPFSTGSQGVFLQRINLEQQQVVNECFHYFPREFMTQDMTQAQIDRMERRETKGRLGPQLYNYAIRSVHPVEDGSTIVVAEQYYVYQQNSTDSKGITQTMYHYYFNDIMIYKIDSAGTFNWITRMQKEQHSVNDYGYYSSIKTLVSDGKLLCFFNDNSRNYDEMRNYEDFYRPISFPIRKKSYALALGEIDIATGSVKRTIFNDYTESDGFVVLRLSPIDYHNHQLLLYAQGRRDRFGVVQF